MKLLIVAGEASSDAHAAALVRELLRRQGRLRIVGLGGPRMAAAGVELLADLTEHAVIGVGGLLGGLGGILSAYRRVTHLISARPPDAVVLVDTPEFNLPVARHAARLGVPVIYYVSPQVWAWRTGRVRKIANRVRKMLCLFEFEKDLYERAGVDVTHVGHPLLDTMSDKLGEVDRAALRRDLGLSESGTVVGLLPGSRRKEVGVMLPLMLESAGRIRRELPEASFVVARAEALPPDEFRRADCAVVTGRTYDVMLASDVLLCCSGTATLEAAILGTPMVATYKASVMSYVGFGLFLRPGHFALPNIVAGKTVVPELYVRDATPGKIADAALGLLRGGLEECRSELAAVREKLGGPGASARAADEVLKFL
jgi:lipid-A-disaccharide synthase